MKSAANLALCVLLCAGSVLATPCDDTSLRVAYENAKGAATTAVQKSGASYCAMKEAQSKMLANSCGVLSPSQSPRPYAGNEDGLTTCVQAAIAPLQTGFFEPTLISGNRDVFSGAIPPKSVFPVSVGCAYQNVVATAVRFRTPANQQAGSIRLWQLNGINLLLSLTPNAVSRSDIGDYLIGIYDDDGAVVPAPKTQIRTYTRISSLTSSSSVNATPTWVSVPLGPAGWEALSPNASYWVAITPGATATSFTEDGVVWNGFEPTSATPTYQSDNTTFSAAIVFRQYCSQSATVTAVQGLANWATDLGARVDARLRYGLEVYGSAANPT